MTELRLYRLIAGVLAPSYTALRRKLQFPDDKDYGGIQQFTGTIQDDSRPVQGRVRVLDAVSGVLVNQRWSDPVTGAYTIPGLKVLPEGYDVILYSPTYATRAHVFRGVNPE